MIGVSYSGSILLFENNLYIICKFIRICTSEDNVTSLFVLKWNKTSLRLIGKWVDHNNCTIDELGNRGNIFKSYMVLKML